MTSRSLSDMSNINKELLRRRTVPASHRKILEERLAIAFKPLERQTRETTPRPIRDVRRRYKRKKAQKVYLDILDEDPHAFLSFILAISPKACERFEVSSFFQSREKQSRIPLNISTRAILHNMAKEHEFSQSHHYQIWIDLLFPGSPSQPIELITTIRHNTHWKYHGASLEGIRIVFGNGLYEFLEGTLVRQGEKEVTPTLQTTECVRMNVPRRNFQDVIICIDVGPAREFARILFPQASHKMLFPNDAEDGQAKDTTSFTLNGASAQAIELIFAPRIRKAIENSNLRKWERERGDLRIDVTDCVMMELTDNDGTLYLRTGFIDSISIAKDLYSDTSLV
ncbi:hypothetical protein P154DRAFT_527053 [Amniculicola lignicola CBS 123094]|uniref:Uncharacterized protein n=1 Tax=Amniculicola lignicola CBS 123094 TaxID=1392246 RepID=A0A6A5VY67_9PLEO|nr:hypothetical protein P154DRAFT_527053 [Amniculicola lignicola CBS 123094]